MKKIIPIQTEVDSYKNNNFKLASKKKALIIILPYFVGKTDALGAKTRSFLSFPYGPLTIASYVNKKSKNNSDVEILDLNLTEAYETQDLLEIIKKRLSAIKIDVLGFSFMFDTSFPYLMSLSKGLKISYPTLPIIVGGAAATTGYEELLDLLDSVDAVCYGEGEQAMLDLLDFSEEIEFGGAAARVPWITKKNLKKPDTNYVESLDDVVDLDYSLVDTKKYSMKESFSPFAAYRYQKKEINQFFLVTSRGCPFKCTFCAEPSLHGAKMRFASVEKIISHVSYLKETYDINVLTLYDDQLLIDLPRAKNLFRELKRFNLRIEMPNGVTAVFIDQELAFLMKEAGVDTIPLAIESGSDYVLRNIIIKPLRLNKLPKIVGYLRKAKIFVIGYFVIGMPGEEDSHRKETYDLIKSVDLDWASFSIAAPVRGSELYKQAKLNGWLPPNYGLGSFEGNQSVLNIPGRDPADIEKQTFYLNLRCNFVENRSLRTSDYETAERLFKEVSERTESHAFALYFLAVTKHFLGDLMGKNEAFLQYVEITDKADKWKMASDYFQLASSVEAFDIQMQKFERISA